MAGGALILGIIGAIGVWGRTIFHTIMVWVRRYISVSLYFTDEDVVMYNAVCDWIKDSGLRKKPRRLLLQRNVDRYGNVRDASKSKADMHALADNEIYWNIWKGTLVNIISSAKETEMGNHIRSLRIIFYFRSPKFLEEVKALFEHSLKASTTFPDYIRMYKAAGGEGQWNRNLIKKRDPSTLWIPEDVRKDTIEDIEKFLNSREVYERIGKPYRRGYLFKGPPGTGKSSYYQILANIFGKPVYVFTELRSLSGLKYAWSQIPSGSIIVMEDIDCAGANVKSRSSEDEDEDDEPLDAENLKPEPESLTRADLARFRKVFGDPSKAFNVGPPNKENSTDGGAPVLSSLLSHIDGADAITGVIQILVTNHPEKLDPALLRKGRTDKHVNFRYATMDEAVEYCKTIVPDVEQEVLEAELAQYKNEEGMIPPCDMQEALYQLYEKDGKI